MSGIESFPFPDDAPEPGACVRVERPEPGLAVVVLDPPHRSLAVLDAPLLRDLEQVVGDLERDRELRGIVLAGREPLQFAAGADVEGIGAIDDPIAVNDVVRWVHRLFLRIERLKPTTVAAVGGPVPGGAYEIALCCDRIVAAEHAKTRIGLPETQLGILPAWGGSHRLPQRVGVPTALELIVGGKLLPAKPAKKRGMVDRLAHPKHLHAVAANVAMGRERLKRRRRGWKRWLVDRNPAARALMRRQTRKMVMARTGGHYPAPLAAMEVVLTAPGKSRRAAEDREAQAVVPLITGPVCKNLVSIFFAGEEAKKVGKGGDDFQPREFARAGVIGGGTMGGGIASLLAEKGVEVRLADVAREPLDEALAAHHREIEKRRKRRRLEDKDARAAMDRLTATTEMDGMARAQVIVEAVAERMEVKRKVLGGLAEKVADDCLLATNTSSLSVDEIADALPHPERVVGMHFFNPPRKMPLVEVVRGARTSDATVAETAALAVRLGKTPVVVRDVAGFLVNRLLGPYLDEAVRLFVDGADPERLDRVMKEFGMPMGPLRLLDEVGFDIAAHASESLHEAYGVRMTPSEAIPSLMADDRLGAKTGRGFYRHPKDGKPELMDDLGAYQKGSRAASLTDEQLVDRMVLAMGNEAARCVEEEVVASPRMLDLATVYGTGFAPFRGGLLHHLDALGTAETVRRLEAIAGAADVQSRTGGTERFTPAAWLRELAQSDRKIFTSASGKT